MNFYMECCSTQTDIRIELTPSIEEPKHLLFFLQQTVKRKTELDVRKSKTAQATSLLTYNGDVKSKHFQEI